MTAKYTIKSITEVPRVDRAGEITKEHRVRAISGTGQHFEVSIPDDEFTDGNVRAKVQERANLIDGLVG